MNTRSLISVLFGLTVATIPVPEAPAADVVATTPSLAETLSRDGQHAAAALEFRRSALAATSETSRASFYWSAAYEYGKAGELALAEKMLNLAENSNPLMATEALLLRGENAMAGGAWPEAEFYYQGLTQGTNQPVRRLASRQLAITRLRQHNPEGAREALLAAGGDETPALHSLDTYRKGADKSPRIGGLLGLIPGLGYAYSGEYANMARSMILNGIFLFGVIKTARDDEWGACTAISFFEITWYSGSIYGGVDAAYRYNQTRLNRCCDDITGKGRMEPDYTRLPILTLQYQF